MGRMKEEVSLEAVKKTAMLARLAVDEEQYPHLQAQLSHLLTWVARLNEVEEALETVPVFDAMRCLYQQDTACPLRDDVPDEEDHQTCIQSLSNTQQAQHGYFTVPPVIE